MNLIIARGLLIPFLGTVLGSAQITEAGALSLALGIAIQNFPEGAIISTGAQLCSCSALL